MLFCNSDDKRLRLEAETGHIFDSNQFLAGSVILDCLPANNFDLHLIALARWSEEDVEKCEKHLRIGLRHKAPLDWDPEYFNNISQPIGTATRSAKHVFLESWDRRRFHDRFYPLYVALLVEMREGIAYRIGIGKVHIDAFHAANAEWEEVRLG